MRLGLLNWSSRKSNTRSASDWIQQLCVQLAAFGLDGAEAHAKGLNFFYVSPVELQIDSIVATIYRTVRESGVRRIVIDAVGDLMMATTDTHRLHSYLYALAQHFAVQGVSSLFTYETIGKDLFTETRMSALADNIVLLSIQFDGRRAQRRLRVVKARGIAHDLDEHDLAITSRGIEVS